MLGEGRIPFTAVPRFTSLRMILVISKLFFLFTAPTKQGLINKVINRDLAFLAKSSK